MKRFTLAVITGALALNAAFAAQADDLKPVIKAGKEISKLAVSSQQKINGIAEQTQTKFQQYQMVNKEIEGLATSAPIRKPYLLFFVMVSFLFLSISWANPQ